MRSCWITFQQLLPGSMHIWIYARIRGCTCMHPVLLLHYLIYFMYVPGLASPRQVSPVRSLVYAERGPNTTRVRATVESKGAATLVNLPLGLLFGPCHFNGPDLSIKISILSPQGSGGHSAFADMDRREELKRDRRVSCGRRRVQTRNGPNPSTSTCATTSVLSPRRPTCCAQDEARARTPTSTATRPTPQH